MQLRIGDLVHHPRRPDWGIGKVLRIDGGIALVFFENGPADNPVRSIDTAVVPLHPADVDSYEPLDHLPALQGDTVTGGQTYFGKAAAIARFRHLFPEGFEGRHYCREERDYKWAAHLEARRLLAKSDLGALLESNAYAQIVRRSLHVIGKVNLLSPFEQMAFRDGVRDPEHQGAFARALVELLHGSGTHERRFTRYAEMLRSLPQRQARLVTWPNQTILAFLYDPQVDMFMKPLVTKQAAERLAFDLKYRPEPNWDTYSRLLKLATVWAQQIQELKPKDFIDIESFIWCIGDDSYKAGPPNLRLP